MIYRDPEPGSVWQTAAIGALVLFALAIAGTSDYAEEVRADRFYCEMVEIHQASGGEHGWPDFDNKWDECEEILYENENTEPVG